MARTGLDATDGQILSALRHDARLTIPKLAEKVGLTATPCRLRVKALEEKGLITGYTIVGAATRPRTVTKFMMIEATVTTKDVLSTIEQILRSHAAVREIYTLEGRHDYMVLIADQEGDRTKDIIKDLREANCVNDTMTLSVMDHMYTQPAEA